MNLDCNTPKGREYIKHQHSCLKKFCNTKGITYASTNDKKHADVDAILIKEQIVGICEVKCRDMTLNQLTDYGSYLITNEKIEKLQYLSNSLQCHGLLLVYLIPEDIICYWYICDTDGNLLLNYDIKTSETQATCNGGKATRENAYLPLQEMKVL